MVSWLLLKEANTYNENEAELMNRQSCPVDKLDLLDLLTTGDNEVSF